MLIFLIRHTKFDNPKNIFPFHLPLNLSVEGRSQAEKIGEWFSKNNYKKIPIFSSPIARCIQTSEIIASKTGSFVTFDNRLIEASVPDLQGTKRPSKNSWIKEEDYPTRETRESQLTRVRSIFEEKVKAGKDCILVSHGEPLTVFYYYLTKQKLPKYLWSPENLKNVIRRGDVYKLLINNKKLAEITKVYGFG